MLLSMVGTTTSVDDSEGIPLEKSIRGSGCGMARRVAKRLTKAMANSLTDRRQRTPTNQSKGPPMPSERVSASIPAEKIPAKSRIKPR